MAEEKFDRAAELEGLLRQVAGQLKGSLGNIHSALERLAPVQAREGDKTLDRDAAVLQQSYYRILRLTGNLEAAALLDGPANVVLENCDIVALCRDLVRRAEHCAGLLELELAFICGKDYHVIAVDRVQVERLILNLLSNAFKFTPAGGKITVELRFDATVELRVVDTGCGMGAEKLERLFDRRIRPDALEPPPHGLGLGLPICRKIALDHGGTILVTSREGEGTMVLVSLPNRRTRQQQMTALKVDYAGGFNHVLLELADALPRQAFTHEYMD